MLLISEEWYSICVFFFSSRRRHTRGALVTGSSDVCSSDLGHGRFRVSAFVQRDSVAAVLRLVPAAIPTFDELGLPEVVRSWSGFRRGLVLVCGQHASGTSTTLAALVDEINRTRACHIPTIERDRKRVGSGKSVSVRVDLGGRLI